jgi:hypothetical protein
MTPICRQCVSVVVPEGARDKPYQWLCILYQQDGIDYVSGDPLPPYRACRDVNKYGLCEKFERGHNVFNPKEPANG